MLGMVLAYSKKTSFVQISSQLAGNCPGNTSMGTNHHDPCGCADTESWTCECSSAAWLICFVQSLFNVLEFRKRVLRKTAFYNHDPQARTVDFPAPWEEDGTTRFAGKPAFILGGASSVGQYGMWHTKRSSYYPS